VPPSLPLAVQSIECGSWPHCQASPARWKVPVTLPRLEALALALGDQPCHLALCGKTAYHAAMVMASNDMATLSALVMHVRDSREWTPAPSDDCISSVFVLTPIECCYCRLMLDRSDVPEVLPVLSESEVASVRVCKNLICRTQMRK